MFVLQPIESLSAADQFGPRTSNLRPRNRKKNLVTSIADVFGVKIAYISKEMVKHAASKKAIFDFLLHKIQLNIDIVNN